MGIKDYNKYYNYVKFGVGGCFVIKKWIEKEQDKNRLRFFTYSVYGVCLVIFFSFIYQKMLDNTFNNNFIKVDLPQ